MSSRKSKKGGQTPIFTLSDEEKRVLQLGAGDLSLFTEWYFERNPIFWQTWFHHRPQKRKILVAGIRSGKTYCISLGFPHFSIFNPHSRIANASISADQAKIVYFNVLDLVSMPRFARFVKDTVQHPFPRIELINGSQMWFRSVGYEAELWRGWEFDWINFDEAAYSPSRTTYDTLQGRLIGFNHFLNRPRHDLFTVTTSPKGRTSWIYEEFLKGLPESPNYNPQRNFSLRVKTTDNPYLDPAMIEDLMSDYSDRQRQQELEGAFLDPDDAVFNFQAIQHMCDTERPEVAALTKKIDQLPHGAPGEAGFPKIMDTRDYVKYQLPPEPHRDYIVSWDLGTTATRHVGRNATIGMVFDTTTLPWRLVAFRREIHATYSLIIQWIKEWHLYYNCHGQSGVETVIDASGSGKPVEEILKDEHNLPVEGLVYTTSSKPTVINAGAIAIERAQVITPPIRSLNDELASYEIHDKKIVQDCVMAFCQGLHRARMRHVDLGVNREEIIVPTRTGYRQLAREATRRFEERRRASRSVRSTRNR